METKKRLSAKDAKKREEIQNRFFPVLTSRPFASFADKKLISGT